MKILRIFLFFTLITIVSCNKEDVSSVNQNNIEELYWVNFEQSSMPVILAGNKTSDIIIIRIHGGPGGSSVQEYQASDWVDAFEKDYLMAYWDQPFSGYSIQNDFPVIENFNIAYYRQSLEAVVDFLNSKMPDKKIILWGQSWGGLILSDFITEPSVQSKYAGWINESGLNTNGYRDYRGLRASIIEQAQVKISQGQNIWVDRLEWMVQNPYNPAIYDFNIWDIYESYADELLAPLEPEAIPIEFNRREYFLYKQSDRDRIEFNTIGNPFNSQLFASDKLYFFNKDNMISNISKKGIFIQGKLDRSVSLKSSTEFAQLSAPFTTLLIYESSGHNPSITERERFINDVKDYLKQL